MKIRLEKTKSFWVYSLGGFLGVLLGIALLPLWAEKDKDVFFKSWGGLSVNIMISGLLLSYVLLYLVKRVRRYSGSPASIVAIVEMVVMVIIAVVCTVSAFVDSISFGDPCQIFGLALWARGVSGVFTGYYCDSELVAEVEKENKEKKSKKKTDKPAAKKEIDTNEEPRGRVDDFTVCRLSVAVALISIGVYLFVLPPFGALFLQWVFSFTIVAVGLFFTVYGLFLKPKKIKVDEPKVKPQGDKSEENKPALSQEKKTPALDEGKVNIKLETSANAMTNTATIDAVTEQSALVPIDTKKKKKK